MPNNPNKKTKNAEDRLNLNEKYNTNDLFNSYLARKHGWKYLSDIGIDETAVNIQDERDDLLKPKKNPMIVNKVRFKKIHSKYRPPTTPASVITTTPASVITTTRASAIKSSRHKVAAPIDEVVIQIPTVQLTIQLAAKMTPFYESSEFIDQFTDDIAKAAGVSQERIRVLSVDEGSIIVEFEILPPLEERLRLAKIEKLKIQIEALRTQEEELSSDGDRSEILRTQVAKIEAKIVHEKLNDAHTEPTVNMVVANLKKQIKNKSSKLRTGKHTNIVDINTPLKVKNVMRFVKISAPRHIHSHIKKLNLKLLKKLYVHAPIHSPIHTPINIVKNTFR